MKSGRKKASYKNKFLRIVIGTIDRWKYKYNPLSCWVSFFNLITSDIEIQSENQSSYSFIDIDKLDDLLSSNFLLKDIYFVISYKRVFICMYVLNPKKIFSGKILTIIKLTYQ